MPDFNRKWLLTDEHISPALWAKNVRYWNPLLQVTKKWRNGIYRFTQRTDLFDNERSATAEMVTLNPESGGLDGQARFGSSILLSPEFDELIASAPGSAHGQGCIISSQARIDKFRIFYIYYIFYRTFGNFNLVEQNKVQFSISGDHSSNQTRTSFKMTPDGHQLG